MVEYTPPEVWTWDQQNGGEFANINRPVAGATEEKILPIGKHPESKVYVRLLAAEGLDKPASTRWVVERRVAGRTLLRLFPRTGRRHQLRVHLEAIGHPILGDPLYGRPDADYLARVRGETDPRLDEDGPQRLMLHCTRMIFPDPNGAGRIDVHAVLPGDMQNS